MNHIKTAEEEASLYVYKSNVVNRQLYTKLSKRMNVNSLWRLTALFMLYSFSCFIQKLNVYQKSL